MISIFAFIATPFVVLSLLAIFFNEKDGGSLTRDFLSSYRELISDFREEAKKEKISLFSEACIVMSLWTIVIGVFLSIVLICIVIPMEIIAFATHICAEIEMTLHNGGKLNESGENLQMA